MSKGGRTRQMGIAAVAAATLATVALGYIQKSPCLERVGGGREFRLMCFTDVETRYTFPGVADKKLPYLHSPNEYPVLTGFAMYAASLPSGSPVSFFNWTALLLTAGALAVAWALHRMVGRRVVMFALAPTLLVYAFFNWDLLAVSLATLGLLAYLKHRDGLAGALLGLGTAAKLYPALLLLPFAVDRWREGRRTEARLIVSSAAAAWLLVNLPVAIAAPRGWWNFYQVSSTRGTDLYSLWALPERYLHFTWPVGILNVLVATAFVGMVAWLWRGASARRPRFPLWTLGFPLLAAFLLTGKAYSPAYSLWLLPWFALTLPDWRLFAAFEVADIAVFVTVFQWSRGAFGAGIPFWAVEVAVLVRAIILVASLIAWRRAVVDEPVLPIVGRTAA